MKPHEETWTVVQTLPGPKAPQWGLKVDPDPGMLHVALFADEARANLAAQAPAMARLLMALHKEPEPSSYSIRETERVLRDAGVIP